MMELANYVQIALQVIGVASVVAAVTPTPVDNAVLVVLRNVLDIFAANWLNAKNAASTKTS